MKIKSHFTVLFIVIFALSGKLFAQENDLMVQGISPKIHLVHKVAAKETWYSIGRLYNLNPKEIAPFNNLKMEAPLAIGQALKIPLNATNFSQNGSRAAGEVMVPVFHVVQEKEWMFRISQNYNKVPIDRLEKWNNVTNDNLKPGMKLIVGYLKVKPGQSALASKAKNVQQNTQPPVVVNKPQEKPLSTTPPKEEKKDDTEKQDAVVKTETKPPVAEPRPVVNRSIDYSGGFFRSQFGGNGRSTTGIAGIFKSTSGWQDGKYYALMNNVPVGTIIKIDHPVTRKSVYAKVLGQLPDMKESVGLAVRLSDAAAAELGAGAFKFNVDVSY